MKRILHLVLLALATLLVMPAAAQDVFSRYSGEVVPEGDYLIVYQGKAMKAEISTNRFGYVEVDESTGSIIDPDASIIWTILQYEESGFILYNNSANVYAASTGKKNQGTLVSDLPDDNAYWSITGTETYEFINIANQNANVNCNLRNNGTYGFATYATGTGGALTLYKLGESNPDIVAKPIITASTSFLESVTVEMTAAEGADIFYTIDGSDPTKESNQYTGPITITATTTIKAAAFVDDKSSDIATATYTKIELMSIADAAAAAAGTTCYVMGNVIATASHGMLIEDKTGIIYYYNTAGVPARVGDVVKIFGEVSAYKGKNQFTSTADVQVTAQTAFAHTAEATVMDGAALDAWAAGEQPIQYVTLNGDLAINGNYFNITVDGTAKVLSIVKPIDAPVAGNVTVTGYLMYLNGKYAYMVMTSYRQNVEGDIFTSESKKYQISSNNLVQNGEFNDGVSNWFATNYSTPADPVSFTWNAEGGHDGGAYISYAAGGAGAANAPRTSVSVEAGKTYLFQAFTKGKPSDANLQYNALRWDDSANANLEGSTIGLLKWGNNDEWTETRIVFTAETDTIVRFRSSWTGDVSLDGVGIYEIEYVGPSTEELEAAIASARTTLDSYDIEKENSSYQILFAGIEAAQAVVDNANAETTVEDLNNAIAALNEAIANAEKATFATIANGTYYLRNVGSGLYLSSGAQWGTHATLTDRGYGFDVILTQLENGKYTIDTQVKADKHFLGTNGYVDSDAGQFIFKEVTDGKYTISTGSVLFGFDGTKIVALAESFDDAEAAQWQLVSAEEITAQLAGATEVEPVEIPVKGYSFNYIDDNRNAAWSVAPAIGGYRNSGNTTITNTHNGERWNKGAEQITQTMTELPNGFYKVTAFAFYRTGNIPDQTAIEQDNAYIIANGNAVALKSVVADGKTESETGFTNAYTIDGNTIYAPNTQTDAAYAFAQGLYVNEIVAEVTDGTLTFGFEKRETIASDWLVFDEIQLFYLGTNTPTGIATNGISSVTAPAAAIYNLNGQRVSRTTRGIYVVGGKKVVIK
ncbi:MAG: chitobiase/beta-hexosaminidase C-terminal domain-containing protein [Bacteroidaceae bacterium]|nr:chitobiase/beta-hexosaminidase C-terminal domain-containing protein [Bacteroidaceae bacterium]